MRNRHEPPLPEGPDLSRLFAVLQFLTILSTSVAGVAAAPWWAVIIGTLVLTLLAQLEHKDLYDRADDLGVGWEAFKEFVIPSLRNSAIATTAAYVLGRVVRSL